MAKDERFDPDRTVLTLSFAKKAMKKSDEKKRRKRDKSSMKKFLPLCSLMYGTKQVI
ncbi:MAG: hypothetical protein ACLTGQ_07080 [Mediterraneibacter gnavus]